MKFIGAHIFDYDATFRSNVNVTGNLDVDGTINIDAADIDGNLQLDGTLTVGVDDTGYDVIFYGATSGRYMKWNQSDDKLKISDGAEISFGNADDLKIYHDGSNSYIKQQNARTGNLYIDQDTNDADIVFRNDDGSGGRTPYITLDGSATTINISKNMLFPDAVEAKFGDSTDLKIKHAFNNGEIENNTGNLNITNYAGDKDIVFRCDDGSGGVETYFFLDGSSADVNYNYTVFPDLSVAAFGNDKDLRIFHSSTNSYIQNLVGNLYIQNQANDSDIIFESDDGSGGKTSYMTIDGSAEKTVFTKDVRFNDSIDLNLGSGNDFILRHDGSNSWIINQQVGDLYIRQNVDDKDIIFQCDDGSGGVATYITIDGDNTLTEFSKGAQFASGSYVKLLDGIVSYFGTGNDLRIWHSGSDSFISHEGDGDLYIRNLKDDKDILFQCDDGSGGTGLYFYLDGSAAQTKFNKDTRHIDNVKVLVGSSGDAAWWHDGTKSRLDNYTGNLEIANYADDSDIVFKSDDGSGGTTEYFKLDGSRASASVLFTVWPDNSYIALGNAVDLKLHHNGTFSVIENEVGDLNIINDANDKDIAFYCDDGSGGVTAYIRLDGSDLSTKILTQKLIISNLPTSDPGVSGQVWNNNGALNISAGG